VVIVIGHLLLLHEKGSSNPTSTAAVDKIKFHPLFSLKDSLPIILISIATIVTISTNPNLLGDVENFNTANPLNAPLHIQPEWYFLFAYVILRSIPSKLGGVVALALSILVLTILA
jgi:ubiquinol-cytochrome c reductase cytochrome b subunit